MSKFDEAMDVGIIYYKNGPFEDLLKIMDEINKMEDNDFVYKSYCFLDIEEDKRYRKEGALPKVDNPILIYFEDSKGKVRFGCYSGNNTIMRNGQKIYTDEFGKEYCLDELGNKIVPTYSKVDSAPGEFTTHDTSQGHCGLCGNIACNGGCFR